MPVTAIIRFKLAPEYVDEALTLLRAVQDTAIAAGAHSMQLLQDQSDPTLLFEIETWDSADAHKAYVEAGMADGGFQTFMSWVVEPPVTHYLELQASSSR